MSLPSQNNFPVTPLAGDIHELQNLIPILTPDHAFSVEPQYQLPTDRDAIVRRVLDPPIIGDAGQHYGFDNYGYARDAGLLDMFVRNPEKGHDGLLHFLVGDVVEQADGSTLVGGFHVNPDPLFMRQQFDTFVDRSHLEEPTNAATRKNYVVRPFEPHFEHVTIQGYRKYSTKLDSDGNVVTRPIDNSMFPEEYDALTALQAVRIARDTRDPEMDVPLEQGAKVATGSVPLIDGVTPLNIRMVLDDDDKVFTAMPMVKKCGYMKLQEDDIPRILGA